MDDCPDLIERLHTESRDQIGLAMIADVVPIIEMHLDLALFAEERVRLAAELCP